jgi:hypothetical protein
MPSKNFCKKIASLSLDISSYYNASSAYKNHYTSFLLPTLNWKEKVEQIVEN